MYIFMNSGYASAGLNIIKLVCIALAVIGFLRLADL